MNENVESSIKLYEYNFEKPELSDDILEHYGIKGMHWGVRRYQNYDGTRIGAKRRTKKSVFKSKKKNKTVSRNKEEALKNNDINYMNENVKEFSTNEINNALNRLNAESRLRDVIEANKRSTKIKAKVQSIIKSNGFKVLSSIAIGAVAITAFRMMQENDMYVGKPKKVDWRKPINNLMDNPNKNAVSKAIDKFNKKNARKGNNQVLDYDEAIMLFGKKKGDDLAAFVRALGPEVGFLGADKVLRNMGLKEVANELFPKEKKKNRK